MDTLFFAVYAVGYTVLFIWALTLTRRAGFQVADLLLPVIAALIYDNVLLAFGGRLFGEGPLLETLHGARFWLHAFLTPLLIIIGWNAMERAGVGFTRQRWAPFAALALYVATVVLDLLVEVRGLELAVSNDYGVLSYGSAEPATGPPPMIMVVIAFLLIASILVWRKQGWPWFFVGVVASTIGNSIPFPFESNAVTNAFEFVLLASLVLTKAYQDRVSGRSSAAPGATTATSPGRDPVAAVR